MKLSDLLAQNPDLDHETELEEGDVVTDVVTLIRVQRLDNTDDALVIGTTDHTGWIAQYGIVQAARFQLETGDDGEDQA